MFPSLLFDDRGGYGQVSLLVAAIHDAHAHKRRRQHRFQYLPHDTINIQPLPMVPTQSPKRRPPRFLVTFDANYHSLSSLSKNRAEDAVADAVEQVGRVRFDRRLKSPGRRPPWWCGCLPCPVNAAADVGACVLIRDL